MLGCDDRVGDRYAALYQKVSSDARDVLAAGVSFLSPGAKATL